MRTACGYDDSRTTTNDGAGDPSEKEVGPLLNVKTNEELSPYADRISGKSDVFTYIHGSRELYAEDVDQHMEVWPDMVTPIAEVTIDDIQVSGQELPLTNDQEQLRQLIWRNKILLINKGNALPTPARGDMRY